MSFTGELPKTLKIFRRRKMKSKSQGFRAVAIFMTVLMFVIAGPYQAAIAALIPTERAISLDESTKARESIKNFLARQDSQNLLISRGISPEEAMARIDSLTDAEALRVSQHIESMPAGGNAIGIIVGAILLVFIILLITDLIGLTDVFPFVKKHK
jgi:hypothetical protein